MSEHSNNHNNKYPEYIIRGVLNTEGALEVQPGQLLRMGDIYFRILEVVPTVFDNENAITINGKFAGIRTS